MTPEENRWFENPESYRLQMEGRWDLQDLALLSRKFEQCYSFIYCFDAEVRPVNEKRIELALRGYPWKGGYSYLNIYSVLANQINWRDKPRVRSIKYASPGWIDLAINADVAVQVAKAIAAIASSSALAVKSYAIAAKALRELNAHRKKMRIKHLKLTARQDAELMKLCNSHAKFLGFKSVAELNKLTGNAEVTLRLVLAHHKRLNDLATLIEEQKAEFPVEQQSPSDES